MSYLSERLKLIKPSPALELMRRVTEMKREGKDVIGLSVGEPDFDTPDHVKEAGIKAIRDGKTKYTTVDGTIELKEAIVEKFRRDNRLDYKPSEITVNSGSKHTIYNALVSTLNPGDEVIIPAPYWMSYPDMVLLTGGKPVIAETYMDKGFVLQPKELEAAITAKTKWLILNSPNNPTGGAYELEDFKNLAEVLRRHPQILVMCDDIYEHLVYDDFKFSTLLNAAPDFKDRVLTMNGVAKAYAMTGWRIGFAGGPEPLIKAISKVQSQMTSNPSSIGQEASITALLGPQDFLKERAAVFQERRDKVIAMLNQANGIECIRPKGAFYVYANVAGLIGKKPAKRKALENDTDVAGHFLAHAGVAVLPGAVFGASPFFRLSYAAAIAELEEACRRIQAATAELT